MGGRSRSKSPRGARVSKKSTGGGDKKKPKRSAKKKDRSASKKQRSSTKSKGGGDKKSKKSSAGKVPSNSKPSSGTKVPSNSKPSGEAKELPKVIPPIHEDDDEHEVEQGEEKGEETGNMHEGGSTSSSTDEEEQDSLDEVGIVVSQEKDEDDNIVVHGNPATRTPGAEEEDNKNNTNYKAKSGFKKRDKPSLTRGRATFPERKSTGRFSASSNVEDQHNQQAQGAGNARNSATLSATGNKFSPPPRRTSTTDTRKSASPPPSASSLERKFSRRGSALTTNGKNTDHGQQPPAAQQLFGGMKLGTAYHRCVVEAGRNTEEKSTEQGMMPNFQNTSPSPARDVVGGSSTSPRRDVGATASPMMSSSSRPTTSAIAARSTDEAPSSMVTPMNGTRQRDAPTMMTPISRSEADGGKIPLRPSGTSSRGGGPKASDFRENEPGSRAPSTRAALSKRLSNAPGGGAPLLRDSTTAKVVFASSSSGKRAMGESITSGSRLSNGVLGRGSGRGQQLRGSTQLPGSVLRPSSMGTTDNNSLMRPSSLGGAGAPAGRRSISGTKAPASRKPQRRSKDKEVAGGTVSKSSTTQNTFAQQLYSSFFGSSSNGATATTTSGVVVAEQDSVNANNYSSKQPSSGTSATKTNGKSHLGEADTATEGFCLKIDHLGEADTTGTEEQCILKIIGSAPLSPGSKPVVASPAATPDQLIGSAGSVSGTDAPDQVETMPQSKEQGSSKGGQLLGSPQSQTTSQGAQRQVPDRLNGSANTAASQEDAPYQYHALVDRMVLQTQALVEQMEESNRKHNEEMEQMRIRSETGDSSLYLPPELDKLKVFEEGREGALRSDSLFDDTAEDFMPMRLKMLKVVDRGFPGQTPVDTPAMSSAPTSVIPSSRGEVENNTVPGEQGGQNLHKRMLEIHSAVAKAAQASDKTAVVGKGDKGGKETQQVRGRKPSVLGATAAKKAVPPKFGGRGMASTSPKGATSREPPSRARPPAAKSPPGRTEPSRGKSHLPASGSTAANKNAKSTTPGAASKGKSSSSTPARARSAEAKSKARSSTPAIRVGSPEAKSKAKSEGRRSRRDSVANGLQDVTSTTVERKQSTGQVFDLSSDNDDAKSEATVKRQLSSPGKDEEKLKKDMLERAGYIAVEDPLGASELGGTKEELLLAEPDNVVVHNTGRRSIPEEPTASFVLHHEDSSPKDGPEVECAEAEVEAIAEGEDEEEARHQVVSKGFFGNLASFFGGSSQPKKDTNEAKTKKIVPLSSEAKKKDSITNSPKDISPRPPSPRRVSAASSRMLPPRVPSPRPSAATSSPRLTRQGSSPRPSVSGVASPRPVRASLNGETDEAVTSSQGPPTEDGAARQSLAPSSPLGRNPRPLSQPRKFAPIPVSGGVARQGQATPKRTSNAPTPKSGGVLSRRLSGKTNLAGVSPRISSPTSRTNRVTRGASNVQKQTQQAKGEFGTGNDGTNKPGTSAVGSNSNRIEFIQSSRPIEIYDHDPEEQQMQMLIEPSISSLAADVKTVSSVARGAMPRAVHTSSPRPLEALGGNDGGVVAVAATEAAEAAPPLPVATNATLLKAPEPCRLIGSGVALASIDDRLRQLGTDALRQVPRQVIRSPRSRSPPVQKASHAAAESAAAESAQGSALGDGVYMYHPLLENPQNWGPLYVPDVTRLNLAGRQRLLEQRLLGLTPGPLYVKDKETGQAVGSGFATDHNKCQMNDVSSARSAPGLVGDLYTTASASGGAGLNNVEPSTTASGGAPTTAGSSSVADSRNKALLFQPTPRQIGLTPPQLPLGLPEHFTVGLGRWPMSGSSGPPRFFPNAPGPFPLHIAQTFGSTWKTTEGHTVKGVLADQLAETEALMLSTGGTLSARARLADESGRMTGMVADDDENDMSSKQALSAPGSARTPGRAKKVGFRSTGKTKKKKETGTKSGTSGTGSGNKVKGRGRPSMSVAFPGGILAAHMEASRKSVHHKFLARKRTRKVEEFSAAKLKLDEQKYIKKEPSPAALALQSQSSSSNIIPELQKGVVSGVPGINRHSIQRSLSNLDTPQSARSVEDAGALTPQSAARMRLNMEPLSETPSPRSARPINSARDRAKNGNNMLMPTPLLTSAEILKQADSLLRDAEAETGKVGRAF
eukprot:GSA25T00002818001.1